MKELMVIRQLRLCNKYTSFYFLFFSRLVNFSWTIFPQSSCGKGTIHLATKCTTTLKERAILLTLKWICCIASSCGLYSLILIVFLNIWIWAVFLCLLAIVIPWIYLFSASTQRSSHLLKICILGWIRLMKMPVPSPLADSRSKWPLATVT